MFHEALQNEADQTDVEAIINVAHAKMDWNEMAPWLQVEQTSDNAHTTFSALKYEEMPIAL